jgi:hypothetical protein
MMESYVFTSQDLRQILGQYLVDEGKMEPGMREIFVECQSIGNKEDFVIALEIKK